MDYLSRIGSDAWALFKGFRITLKYLFSPAVTVQYPLQRLAVSPRFRGALAFHEDTCIACEMCVRACPSRCISLEAKRNDKGKKDLLWYRIDLSRCNFCRLCEEACPTKPKSVHHSPHYELLFGKREDFVSEWRRGKSSGVTDSCVWRRYLPVPDRPRAKEEKPG